MTYVNKQFITNEGVLLGTANVPERDLIKVHSPFLFNEVYVGKDDYDFVLEYIRNYTGK